MQLVQTRVRCNGPCDMSSFDTFLQSRLLSKHFAVPLCSKAARFSHCVDDRAGKESTNYLPRIVQKDSKAAMS